MCTGIHVSVYVSKCSMFDDLVHVHINFGAFLLQYPLSQAPTETFLLHYGPTYPLISVFFLFFGSFSMGDGFLNTFSMHNDEMMMGLILCSLSG